MLYKPEDLLVAEFKHLLIVQGIFCLHQRLSGIKVQEGVIAEVLLAQLAGFAEAQVEGLILEVELYLDAQC